MAFRIILLLVVVMFFIFPEIWEWIKTIFGAFLVTGLGCGIAGCVVNWVVTGHLLCWDAFKTGIYVGLIIVGVIIVLNWIIKLVR